MRRGSGRRPQSVCSQAWENNQELYCLPPRRAPGVGREGHSLPGARPPGPSVSEIPAQSYGAAPGASSKSGPPSSLRAAWLCPRVGRCSQGDVPDFCPHPRVSSYPDRKDPQQFLSRAQALQTCPSTCGWRRASTWKVARDHPDVCLEIHMHFRLSTIKDVNSFMNNF